MSINGDLSDYEELSIPQVKTEVPRKINGCVFPIDPIKKYFLMFILLIKTNDKLILSHWMVDDDIVKLTLIRIFDLIWSSNLVMRTFDKSYGRACSCICRLSF